MIQTHIKRAETLNLFSRGLIKLSQRLRLQHNRQGCRRQPIPKLCVQQGRMVVQVVFPDASDWEAALRSFRKFY